MQRIAFIGVHSGGKTTTIYGLAHYLKLAEKSVEIIPEAARMAASRGFAINENTTLETQLWLFGKQIQLEVEAQRNNPDYILQDRTAADLIVYYMASNKMQLRIIDKLQQLIDDYTQFIPLQEAFYFSPLDHITKDGVRNTNIAWQAKVHKLWQTYLINSDKIHILTGTSRKARLAEVIKILGV